MNLREALNAIASGSVRFERTKAVEMVAAYIETLRDQIAALEADMEKLRRSHLPIWPQEDAPEPSAASGGRCAECNGERKVCSCGRGAFCTHASPCPACHGTGAAAEAKGQHKWVTVEDVDGGVDYYDATQCEICGVCLADTGRVYLTNSRADDGPEHCPGCRISEALKSAQKQQQEKCVTCAGTGTSKGGHMHCPDCRGSGREADAEPQPPQEQSFSDGEEIVVLLSEHNALVVERDRLRAELSLAAERERIAHGHRADAERMMIKAEKERDAAIAGYARVQREIADRKDFAQRMMVARDEWARRETDAQEALTTARALCDELRKACAEKEALMLEHAGKASDAAESALERARGLATEWCGYAHGIYFLATDCGRELLAAIEGKND